MRSLATILTLLIPSMLTGQTIDHFADSTARWNVANTELVSTPGPAPQRQKVETTNYGFQGDTVINGKQWLKMVATKDTAFSENLKLQGYIRSQGPVVLYQDLELSKKPDTLYDFSLEVGDSIQYDFPEDAYIRTPIVEVKQVDSIRVNGEFHKRIIGGQMGAPLATRLTPVWIEGIGSIHGPLFPREATVFSEGLPEPLDLACTKVNSRQYYDNLDYSECQPNKFVGVADPEQQSLSVQPNPFQDYVRVTMEKVRQATLSLYNAQGQPVLRKPITRGQARLSVSHLTPGMYIAQLRSRRGVQTVKLVKER